MNILYTITTELIASDSNAPVSFQDLQEITAEWRYEGYTLETLVVGGQVKVFAYRGGYMSPDTPSSAGWVEYRSGEFYLVIAEESPAPNTECATCGTPIHSDITPAMCEECASLVIDRHLEGADETAPALIQKSGHMIPYSVTNPLIGNRGSVIRLDDVRVIVARWHESGWEFSAGIGGRDSENLEIQATRTTSNNPMPLIASGWKFPTPNYGWITVAIEKNRR